MVGKAVGPSGKIKDTIEKVALHRRTCLLITGDNGVGKELVARWIHEKSNRNTGRVNGRSELCRYSR